MNFAFEAVFDLFNLIRVHLSFFLSGALSLVFKFQFLKFYCVPEFDYVKNHRQEFKGV